MVLNREQARTVTLHTNLTPLKVLPEFSVQTLPMVRGCVQTHKKSLFEPLNKSLSLGFLEFRHKNHFHGYIIEYQTKARITY